MSTEASAPSRAVARSPRAAGRRRGGTPPAGAVYRTRDLARWSRNPVRLARRLEREGLLVQLSRGLYYRPSRAQGEPADEAIVRAVMGDHPFVLTGSERWNALGLGTVKDGLAMVYNTRRSGVLQLGDGRELLFRRVAFPRRPSPEWSVIDLLENAHRVQADKGALLVAVRREVAQGRFERAALWRMANRASSAGRRESFSRDTYAFVRVDRVQPFFRGGAGGNWRWRPRGARRPPVARRWGFLMNVGLDSFASLFEKHAGSRP